MKYININPIFWTDYELLDSGHFEKLERFGKFVLVRPEPQALWNKSLPDEEWNKRYDAKFVLDVKGSNGEKGFWDKKVSMPPEWSICYEKLKIRFNLSFNSFKHVGVFPEQAENWDYINESIKSFGNACDINVLNLFAYTGGASFAACRSGAKVFHVDAVRQVINKANINMTLSGLSGISWICEDALKFVRREVKRDKKYNGIILDPPAFGRGPDGEIWQLEKNITELISLCSKLLKPKNSFFILNLYSLGFSPLIAYNIVNQYFIDADIEYGEIFIADKFNKKLPLGIYIRFKR
jgi:23S rRNA (cytosine1962-C5)-methyltransferase